MNGLHTNVSLFCSCTAHYTDCSADDFNKSITDYGVCYTKTVNTTNGEIYETGESTSLMETK